MTFKVGEKAVYPAHGVGVIKRIESRQIGGREQDFYLFQVQSSNVMLMIPVEAVDRAGLRKTVSLGEVAEVMRILKSPSKPSSQSWNRRFRKFNEKLSSGSIIDIAEVVRDLNQLREDHDMSYGEKKMLDKAFSMILDEVAAATSKSKETIEDELRRELGA